VRDTLRPGYDVDENAIRFSNLFHLLRELVHLHGGWLPLVPALEAKVRMGEHVHDDATAVTAVRQRLYELRHPSDYPGAPGPELAALLDAAGAATTPDEYRSWAYGTLKPALLRAVRVHLDGLDPLTDEPSLRLLTWLEERQRAHVEQLPPPREPPARGPEDAGALPILLREVRPLAVMPPLGDPARDPFVEIREGGDPYLVRELYVNGAENHVPIEPEEQRHFFHGLLDAELCAAELMARNSHEHPEMPWAFHADMARQTWDEVRHAWVHAVLMRQELGCRWGDYPVGFAYFRSIYALDLLDRLALFNGTSEQNAMWRHSHRRKVLTARGQETVARVFDYLLADEVPHVHNGVRWGTHLLGGDERAYREHVRALREGLDETGAPQAASRGS
jgi:uncharacterized protein DUF455